MKNWLFEAFDLRDMARDLSDAWAWATVAVVAAGLVTALWATSVITGVDL